MSSVPVLMYHHVLPEEGFIASSLKNFEQHCAYIAEKGYKTLTAEEFLLYKKGGLTLNSKAIFITFDDGWRNNFIYAYPILKRYQLKATLFVITDLIERASQQPALFSPLQHRDAKLLLVNNPAAVMCNWDELAQMRDVFDIHSHTHTHREFSETAISWEEDLILAREILHKRLGIKSRHLCWPKGEYTTKLVELAQSLGYEVLYTTERGTNCPDNKLNHIKRVAVKRDVNWLKKILFIYSHPLISSFYNKLKK